MVICNRLVIDYVTIKIHPNKNLREKKSHQFIAIITNSLLIL